MQRGITKVLEKCSHVHDEGPGTTSQDCSNVAGTRGLRKEAALRVLTQNVLSRRVRLISRFGEDHVKSTRWTPSTPQRAAWSRPTSRHSAARASSRRGARVLTLASAYPRRNPKLEPASSGTLPQHPAAIRSGSCGRSSSLGPEGATREASRDENHLEPQGVPRIGTGQCVGGQGSRRRRGLASATWRSVDRSAGASLRATCSNGRGAQGLRKDATSVG